MASVTSWTRLEPHPRDRAMGAFAARVADPLWLIARQWQLGELRGEDAGSPVRVDLKVETAPLTRYLPGAPDGTAGVPLDRAVPLDATAESELAHDAADDRAAALAGERFMALLGPLAAGVRAPLIGAYRLGPPPLGTPPATRRRAELLRRSVPDGRKLLTGLLAARKAGDITTGIPGLASDDAAAANTAADAWVAWYEHRAPGASAPAAWRGDRLEYELSVAGPSSDAAGELALVADAHRGGDLDWMAFDVAANETLGAAADGTPEQVSAATLPAGVQLRGLPAARFWQLEPGDVDLGAVSAAPEDLGRLLFTEFAVAYGNDFFLVPVALEAGSLTRVTDLTVRTTFGEAVTVPPADAADAVAGRAPFRLFRPSVRSADGVESGMLPVLVLLPAGTGSLTGPPIEEVLFARDEMANLAWAVERVVPGIDGRGTERAEELHRATGEAPPPTDDGPRYQLVTQVPANWLAMAASATDAAAAERPVLRLIGTPVGQLLDGSPEVHAERIGQEGILAVRRARRARAADGRTLLWITRRTGPGRGESSSGLRFDQLV